MNRQFIQTSVVGFVFAFAVKLISPVLSPYIKSFGFSDIAMGFIYSLFPLSVIIFMPFFGALSDQVGRKTIIRLGISMEILAFMLYIYGAGSWMIILARLLHAVAFTTVYLISLSKIQDLLKDSERGRLAGFFLSMQKVGEIIAPILGGFLADRFFVTMPFFTGIMIMAALLFLLFLHAKDKKISFGTYHGVGQLRDFLAHRPLKGMAILGMVMHANGPALLTFLPLFIVNELSLAYSYVGIAYFVFGAASLFQFYFGSLSDRLGRSKIMIGGTLIKGLMWLLIPFAVSFNWMLVILLIGGIGGAMWNVSAWSLMSDVGEKIKKEASIVSSYSSIAKIGGFASFLVSGFFVQFFSIQALFICTAILVFGGSIASWFYVHEY